MLAPGSPACRKCTIPSNDKLNIWHPVSGGKWISKIEIF